MNRSILSIATLVIMMLSGCGRQSGHADVASLYEIARSSMANHEGDLTGLGDPTQSPQVIKLARAVREDVSVLRSVGVNDKAGRSVIYSVVILAAKESSGKRELTWEESAMLAGVVVRGSSTDDIRSFILVERAATMEPSWRNVVLRHVQALASAGTIDAYWLERLEGTAK